MSHQGNHYPETLEAPESPDAPEVDERDHFGGSAIHALYVAASDLASIGYTADDVAGIIAHVFKPAAAPVVAPVVVPDTHPEAVPF